MLVSAFIAVAILVYATLTAWSSGDLRFLIWTALGLLLAAFDLTVGSLSPLQLVLLLGAHLAVLALLLLATRGASQLSEIHRKHVEELQEARLDSESMRRLKTSFLANMNHEIRTPLTSIIGFSSLLMEEVAEEHRELIKIVERSGQRLLDTLDLILDLAMLEAGTMQLHWEPLNVVEEAQIHAQRIQPVADAKHLTIEVRASEPVVQATLDRACLSRILTRLMSNAIKFTESGRVEIEIGRADGQCTIAVQDSGIGIDDTFLPKIFADFSQASEGMRRAYEGSGLGLAVTRRLVTLLDGEIDVKSEKGKGSTFTVFLPVGRPQESSRLNRDHRTDVREPVRRGAADTRRG